jgi:hypothetical protein
MGSEHTFYDYVEGGVNQIHPWINGTAEGVRTKVNNWIHHLEATKKGDWRRPMAETLTGYCDGLFEMRPKKGNIQYRILGYHGPDAENKQVTLLYCFIKRGDVVPRSACDEASRRIALISANPGARTVLHDFSQP